MERKQTSRLARVVRVGMLPVCIAVLVGCGHLDMYAQAKYGPYAPSDEIFSTERGGDGAASRPLVPNTFPRGQALSSDPAQSGRDANGEYVDNPLEVNEGLVALGKDRYSTFCVPCHGETGAGNGIAASYFKTAGHQPASFYDERLVNERDGYFFEVITNGRNAEEGGMYPYASRVKVNDRWAIVAYIRSLQADPPPGAIPPTPAPTAQGGAAPNATAGAAPNATAGAAPNATTAAAPIATTSATTPAPTAAP